MKSSARDTYTGPQPRLKGTETEFTSRYNHTKDPSLYELTPQSDILFTSTSLYDDEYYPETKPYAKLWLKNGSLLYLDDQPPEYATAPCRTSDALLVHQRAGEQYVLNILKKAGEKRGEDWKVYARTGYYDVYDARGHKILQEASIGFHENYERLEDGGYGPYTTARAALLSYLSSRAVWAGSGAVGYHGEELHQKAAAIAPAIMPLRGYDQLNHGTKTGVDVRSDRIEVRLGDAVRSPWAFRTIFDMTDGVLAMIEHGDYPRDILLTEQPGDVMKQISSDPLTTFGILSNEHITATEHQRRIAHAVIDFADAHSDQIPHRAIQAALDVEQVTDDIEEVLEIPDNLYLISDRVDWAAKKDWMQQKGVDPEKIWTRNLDAVMYDLRWHEVGQDSPSARWYRRFGHAVNNLDLVAAMTTSPNETTDHRLNVINQHNQEMIFCDWECIVTDPYKEELRFKDADDAA